MKSRRSRTLLAGLAAATALATVGIVTATSASADPIQNGAVAQIATQPISGTRYCVIPTGELRLCGSPAGPATQYIFEAKTCWSTKLLCYQIRSTVAGIGCLYYDSFTSGGVTINKIGYGSCTSTSLAYRWRIDELTSFGRVRLRPASSTSRCVVYDPGQLPTTPPTDAWAIVGSTSIEECTSRPESYAWFRLLS
jgi:hypothetical protein